MFNDFFVKAFGYQVPDWRRLILIGLSTRPWMAILDWLEGCGIWTRHFIESLKISTQVEIIKVYWIMIKSLKHFLNNGYQRECLHPRGKGGYLGGVYKNLRYEHINFYPQSFMHWRKPSCERNWKCISPYPLTLSQATCDPRCFPNGPPDSKENNVH